MNVYIAFNKQIIFQKGDPASLFFVIRSGKVIVEINGK